MSRTLLLEQIRAILYNLQYALIRIRLKEYVAAITGTRQPAGTKINCFFRWGSHIILLTNVILIVAKARLWHKVRAEGCGGDVYEKQMGQRRTSEPVRPSEDYAGC